MDEYVDTLYNTKHYNRALKVVEFLRKISICNCSNIVLRTAQNCLIVLENLIRKTKADQLKEIHLIDNQKCDYTDCGLYRTINSFSELVLSIMKSYNKDISFDMLLQNEDVSDKISLFQKSMTEDTVSNTNASINWYFSDIVDGIKEYFKEDVLVINYLETCISKIRVLQDAIQCNKVV